LGPERASPAFYEAAAQVIPVLLLTLAVESRLLGLKGLWSIPVDLQARKVDSLISEIKGEIDALETHLVALGATAKVLEMNDAEEEGAREFWVENVGGELSAMQESLREHRAHVAERGNEIHKLAATYRRPYRIGGVTRALYSIITVAILAAGELWGLWVLAESSEKTSSPNLVVGAIAFGLVAVSVAALRREASGE
jgi:hypothetical protein